MKPCAPQFEIRSKLWRAIPLVLPGVLLLLCTFISPLPGFGALTPSPGGVAEKPVSEEASKEEVRALIQKIENPTKRKTLLKELRLLLRSMDADNAGSQAELSSINHIYAGLIQRLEDSLTRSFRAFGGLPQKIRRIGARWQSMYNEGSVFSGIIRFVAAISLALFFWVGVRRVVRRYLPPANGEGTPSLQEKISSAFRHWLERSLPPAVFLLAGSLFVIFFGLGRMEESLLLIVLWSLFLERALVGAIRAFLAPVRPTLRIIPLTDEISGLISLWGRRFVIVAIWGGAIAQAAKVLELGPETAAGLTNAYRLILLLQTVALILQFRDSVRRLFSANEPEDASGTVRAAFATWNILIARWHFIAVPYLIVFFLLWAAESRDGVIFLITATGMTAGILAAAYVLVRLVRIGAVRLFAVGDRLKALVPGIEKRANQYTPLITRALTGIIWAAAALLVLDAWGLPTLDTIFSAAGVNFFASLTGIVITCAVTIIIIESANATVEYFLSTRRDDHGNLIEPSPHQRTLFPLAYSALKWIAIAVAGIIILGSMGVDIAPVLAGAGILGLAIGFGAQSLVKDIITGFFLLIENNIAIGDIVKVKDVAGSVEGFNLRSVRLRAYNGNVHVIPNSSIDVVTNYTKEYSRVVFDIGVAYKEDVDRVMDVIRRVGEEMAAHPDWEEQILESIEIAGLDRFDDSAVTIRGRIKTHPNKQWGVRREFYRRIKNAFDAEGIEIPFPYRTLTWAKDSPPHPGREINESLSSPPRPGGHGENPGSELDEKD